MSKKIIISILLVLSFVVVLHAEPGGSITIKNETGYNINYLYFSPSDYDDWGDDLLQGEILMDGGEFLLTLDRDIDSNGVFYDLQAVDEDNDYYSIYEADLNDSDVITITMDNYDGGGSDYDDYDDYSGYEDGYNDGYSEGYRQGYVEAFRDAYMEGFKAGAETGSQSSGWR